MNTNMVENFTDEEIVDALIKRNDSILRIVYLEYKQRFNAWVKKKYSIEEVDDLFQEVFTALIVNARKGNLDSIDASVETYFFTIGKYKIYEKFKEKKAIDIDEVKDFAFANVDENFKLNDRQLLLRKVLNEKLRDRCRELLKRFFYKNETADEVMQGMGMKNKNVVKSMKYRCLKRLRQAFNQRRKKS